MMSPSAPDEAATSPLRRNYPLLEQRYPAANAAARVSFARRGDFRAARPPAAVYALRAPPASTRQCLYSSFGPR